MSNIGLINYLSESSFVKISLRGHNTQMLEMVLSIINRLYQDIFEIQNPNGHQNKAKAISAKLLELNLKNKLE